MSLFQMYFDQGSNNVKIQKIIYHHLKFFFKYWNIYILLMYGGIVMKMDNSHLFEVVKFFLFYAWEVINNEIYK